MSTGLLDTSVIVDLAHRAGDLDALPDVALVSAITMAEIVQGPLLARTDRERRAREALVLNAYRAFPDPLPFDQACVVAYRSVAAATVAAGRLARRRTLDLLIAATARAHRLPLYTRNAADVEHLAELIEIVRV